MPKTSAELGSSSPEGSGRVRVRAIRPSVSRSHHMFRALAAPTAMAVPRIAARTVGTDLMPGASQMPPTVITRHIRVTDGLVSANGAWTGGRAGASSTGGSIALIDPPQAGNNPPSSQGRTTSRAALEDAAVVLRQGVRGLARLRSAGPLVQSTPGPRIRSRRPSRPSPKRVSAGSSRQIPSLRPGIEMGRFWLKWSNSKGLRRARQLGLYCR